MEEDNSSSLHRIPPADLLSLERLVSEALKRPGTTILHRWYTARRQTIIPYISNIYSFYSSGLEPESGNHNAA